MIAEPVLVLGAGGMVGGALAAALSRAGLASEARPRAQTDLADLDGLDALAGSGFGCILNAAAWTDVDGAESDEAGATRVNAEAVGRLASVCARTGALLVHYSTDYVFSGDAGSPYPVDAPIAPLNAYGRSKAAGEAAIRSAGAEHLIIRTSWVYAPTGRNFVLTMRRLLREKPEVRVVDDQIGRPTTAGQLARATLELVRAGARGTFHVTGGGEPCTWRVFAEAIARELPGSCPVRPCLSAEFPRPARRPSYSVLDLSAAERVLGPMTNWRDELSATLAQIEAAEYHG